MSTGTLERIQCIPSDNYSVFLSHDPFLSADVYYLAFPKDSVMHKTLVYGAFLLEAAQTFLFTSSAFRTFATGFGNPAVLDEVDTLWFSVPIMSGLGTSSVTQISELPQV